MIISLKKIKDYFKTEFHWTDSISIGKIDQNQEKAVCFYNSKRNLFYSPVIGGKENKSTYIKPITILLRYTKNQDSAEIKAQEIYEFFEERTFYIDEKRIFTVMNTNNPIDLGSDENGVYEYSIELDLYIYK